MERWELCGRGRLCNSRPSRFLPSVLLMARLLILGAWGGRLAVTVIKRYSRISSICQARRCSSIAMLAFRIWPSCIMALSFIIPLLRNFRCRKTNNFHSKALVIMKSTILSGWDTLVVAGHLLVISVMI